MKLCVPQKSLHEAVSVWNSASLSIRINAIFCMMQSISRLPFEVLQKATCSECIEMNNSTWGGFTYTCLFLFYLYDWIIDIGFREILLLLLLLLSKQCENLSQRRGRWSLNIYSRLMTFLFCGLVRNNKASRLPSASAQVSLPPPHAPEWLRNPTL